MMDEKTFTKQQLLLANQASYIKGNRDGIRGLLAHLKKGMGDGAEIETLDLIVEDYVQRWDDYIASTMPAAHALYHEGQEHVNERMKEKQKQ